LSCANAKISPKISETSKNNSDLKILLFTLFKFDAILIFIWQCGDLVWLKFGANSDTFKAGDLLGNVVTWFG
jgi:hypothetical protein